MRSDQVTVKLCDPRGWLYVDKLGHRKWGWEARLGGFHLDGGIERTKRDALRVAEEAVTKSVQTDSEQKA